MSNASSPGFDLFLSHATPDKDWVRTLADHLTQLGLTFFLDERELRPADNFVLALGSGLLHSRFLALILTPTSVNRPWIEQEWTAFMAQHGPAGRVIPVLLDHVELPTILKPAQAIHATHRDAARVAAALAERI